MELLKNLEGLSADEQMSAVVELQKAAMKHLEEQKQASIGKSAEMVILGLKKIKSDFEAKFDSLNYDIQTKVANLKDGEQGLQGPKGEQGDRGLDGAQGKDGKSGIDGKDGLDGKDGVSVQDAKIDFDGSLVITLSDGREINVGEVVPVDVAEKIRTVHNIQSGSGGNSQTVLDAIAALQATIATYGTMATQNANAVAITGGTINNTTVGATTPSTGVFTTLTAQTSVTTPIVGAATGSSTTGLDLNVNSKAQARIVEIGDGTRPLVINGGSAGGAQTAGITATTVLAISGGGGNPIRFYTNGRVTTQQLEVAHTASAVNYVQVTGAATGNNPTISMQGSDVGIGLTIQSKSANSIILQNGAAQRQLVIDGTKTGINYLQVASAATTLGPVLSSIGSDTNIPLVLQPKGTGALQAQQTDSTATGGNARGANAVDWQTARGAASYVASGTYSFLGAGQNNTASGSRSSVLGGLANSATGFVGFVGGGDTNTAGPSNFPVVVGGASNTAAGYYNFIGGGFTNSGTSGSAVTTQSATMNATTAVTLSGSNASIKVGQLISGTSIASYTYVAAISGTSLTLSQAASGSSTSTLSFFTPHGVVVGGGNNQATGSYSFIGGGGDAGTAANRNVASGDFSVVCGGTKNTASGLSSFIGGGGRDANGNVLANTASGIISFIGGGFNNSATAQGATIVGGASNVSNAIYGAISGGVRGSTRAVDGYHAFPACVVPIADSPGVSQAGLLVIARQTTDATATVLTSNTGGASTTNQLILGNNSAYAFKGTVIANVTGGGNTKAWAIEGAIKRGANAASTALVGTPTVTSGYADAGASTWAITATADTTNGGLAITFTGQASTTIRVVAKLETTEVTF